MKVKFTLFSTLFFLFLLSGCKDNTEMQGAPGYYASGIFIINEGPFGGTGTITWHNPSTGVTVQDVFGRENGGAALGAFVQSLTIVGDKAYIAVNGANKIVEVDALSFRFLREITGFELPRYLLSTGNGKAFVSEWGADGVSGKLVLLDLNSGTIVKKTLVGSGPEKMLLMGNEVLIAHAGGFGVDNTIGTVNVSSGEAGVNTLLPYYNPCCIAKGLDNSPFPMIVARGDWMQPASTGWMGSFKIPDFPGYELPQGAEDLCLSPDGSTAYCSAGASIWQLNSNGLTKLLDQPCYGLNCDPKDGLLYCADPKDFNSAGEVVVYQPDGTVVSRFTAGIAPGEVVFIE
ncbi:MAG: hypothetical protein IPL65_18190 [Lewinellaceae bacterium]|nr:hypothetical protein [Lewinellaceae bacterium]